MYTVGELSRQFGLSRSSLLYYDKIGLLQPSGRSAANYRLYSQQDLQRLEDICRYRQAGLTLEAIAQLLESEPQSAGNILQQRLRHLNQEIAELREQQQILLGLLGDPAMQAQTRALDKDAWVAVLEASGMDSEAQHNWHVQFEQQMPEAHQDFLESLGIDAEEIRQIRVWSGMTVS
ncbi:MerR family transcriptional regulator [Aliamphritea ceti]|uniref:MerR family transcriptional regulator n=1 Tax=Aliamphritea ceti TaxID=1524258 RepID=UPI0021C4822A|nr:MerR family transcriptional regulator [Aliamphritea ceti]